MSERTQPNKVISEAPPIKKKFGLEGKLKLLF